MAMEFIGQLQEQKRMVFIKLKTLKISTPKSGPRGVFQFFARFSK